MQSGSPNDINIYEDIDHDGNSDRFNMINDPSGFSHYLFYKDGKQMYQHNLKGHFLNTNFCCFGDYNHDSKNEIYIFWYRADSIFLDVVDAISDESIAKNVFLSQFSYHGQYIDTGIRYCNMNDFDHDGFDELFFDMECGFTITNRKDFLYHPNKNLLTVSDARGINLNDEICLKDISGDGLPEIFGNRRSYGNIHEDYYLTDQKLWLFVPDVNHNNLFSPKVVGEYPGMVATMPLFEKNTPYIASLCVNWGENYDSTFLATYNLKGELVKKINLSYSHAIYESIFTSFPDAEPKYLRLLQPDGYRIEYDNQLHEISKEESFLFSGLWGSLDITGDSKKEYFFKGLHDDLIITDNDFKNPVSIQLEELSGFRNFSVQKIPGKDWILCLNTNKHFYKIQYQKNPFYTVRYPLLFLLWLTFFFIFYLIGSFYQKIAVRRFESEKKLAALQITALEKQLSPHFILNILNSIGSLYETKQTEKAQNLLAKYGKLLHIVLFSSGKLSVSLEKELEFTRNYIELEKARMINAFDYEIISDESLADIQVPKMLVHSFCENAIKHGLRHMKDRKGFLSVQITSDENQVNIGISDNGIGREKAKEYSFLSTGQGLKIVNQTLELYFQLTGVRINYKISDIYDGEEKPAGTKVDITIPN